MSAVRLAESIGGGFYRYDESDGKVARPYIALPADEFEALFERVARLVEGVDGFVAATQESGEWSEEADAWYAQMVEEARAIATQNHAK